MAEKKRVKRKRRRYRLKPRFFVFLGILVLLVILLIMLIAKIFSGGATPFHHRNVGDAFGISYAKGTEIMIAAKGYINTDGLTYNDAYYSGGYPPEDVGVCTDVVWNGFRAIGVDFKGLIDHDTDSTFDAYDEVIAERDPSLDFRLVPVIRVWMDRHALKKTIDPSNLLAWQPGDIVIYDDEHVAIVSGLRNLLGYPYVIQHGHDPAGDENRLFNDSGLLLTDHYRLPAAITPGGSK